MGVTHIYIYWILLKRAAHGDDCIGAAASTAGYW